MTKDMVGVVKYVWRCGKRAAYVEMTTFEMDIQVADEVGYRNLLRTIEEKMGAEGGHTHDFELTEEFENINIALYSCIT